MYSVGEAVTINCADPNGAANPVQWLNSSGTILTFGLTSAALTILSITDRTVAVGIGGDTEVGGRGLTKFEKGG